MTVVKHVDTGRTVGTIVREDLQDKVSYTLMFNGLPRLSVIAPLDGSGDIYHEYFMELPPLSEQGLALLVECQIKASIIAQEGPDAEPEITKKFWRRMGKIKGDYNFNPQESGDYDDVLIGWGYLQKTIEHEYRAKVAHIYGYAHDELCIHIQSPGTSDQLIFEYGSLVEPDKSVIKPTNLDFISFEFHKGK